MLLQIPASIASAGIVAVAILAAALPPPVAAAAAQAQAGAQQVDDALRFTRFDRLKGGSVQSPGGEELGTVEDLVLDCCSGDIRFLILDRGSALGLSATSLALPWSRTAAAPSPAPAQPGAQPGTQPGPVLIARVSSEQLDRMPQFELAEGSAIQTDEWIDTMQRAFEDFADWSQQDRADPFADSLDTSEPTTIEGEIVRIRRDRSFEAAEHIIVEIRSDEGRRAVALGPTWYIMGRANPPLRSADISVEAWTFSGDGDIDAVARSATIGDAEMQLRGEDGSARWTSRASSQQSPGRSSGQTESGRLILASQIVGASATANAQDAGQIKRLVIEQSTGAVAFVEVDPDANFLGLAENTQIVPWEAVTSVAPGRVRFDATAQMLAAAPDSPDRGEAPEWFADEANRNRVYERFEWATGRFGPDDGG